jgi:hypothetical protein
MTNKQTAALEMFQKVCDELKDNGFNVVACVIHYDKTDSNFSTRLSLTANPELGVTDDHIVLDALREISTEWSAEAHKV